MHTRSHITHAICTYYLVQKNISASSVARTLVDKLAPVLNVSQPMFTRIIKYLLHTHSLWFARVRVESDRLEERLCVRALKDDQDAAALVASAQHAHQVTSVTQQAPPAAAEIDEQSVVTVMEVFGLFVFCLLFFAAFFSFIFVLFLFVFCFVFLMYIFNF